MMGNRKGEIVHIRNIFSKIGPLYKPPAQKNTSLTEEEFRAKLKKALQSADTSIVRKTDQEPQSRQQRQEQQPGTARHESNDSPEENSPPQSDIGIGSTIGNIINRRT
jgi:predicted small lipoprotein YifL